MAVLAESQFELDGYVFGRDRAVNVAVFDVGEPEVEVGDLALPGRDGTVFGRDTKQGPELVFEVNVLRRSADDAKTEWALFASRWDAPAARARPGQVVALRMRLPGARTVVAYGRPRTLERTSSLALMAQGRIDATATFQCAGTSFFADGEEPGTGARSITLSLVAEAGGGITWPVTWPIVWGAPGERQDAVVNSGEAPSWPVITFEGPVAQPSLELVGTGRALRLDTTLAFDRSVTIDTRPWVQTVLRDDGASMAGTLRGASLAEFQLPVGQTTLAYRGTDMSGQSRCTVTWRDAYTSP